MNPNISFFSFYVDFCRRLIFINAYILVIVVNSLRLFSWLSTHFRIGVSIIVFALQVFCLAKELRELGNTVFTHLTPLEQLFVVLEPVEQHQFLCMMFGRAALVLHHEVPVCLPLPVPQIVLLDGFVLVFFRICGFCGNGMFTV